MSTDPTQPNPTPDPSPDPLIIPTCATCGHTAASCPECGGRDGFNDGSIVLPPCYWCRKFKPGVGYVEPDSIVGWVSGPDGIYEVATSGDQPIPTIPRESTPERRPINQALYRCCEILADAIQSGQWRDKEEALECWRLLRGDVERHIETDEQGRLELVAWVAEMAKLEPRIEFATPFLCKIAADIQRVAHLSHDEQHAAARHLAEQCARAARVTGWREGGQS